MSWVIGVTTLQKVFTAARGIITYQALADEPDCNKFLPPDDTLVHVIPPDKQIDPLIEAKVVTNKFKHYEPVVVLVPGQQFDASGNRQGRGGGWYDRFLSVIPVSWTRVGLCYPHQLSSMYLSTKSHDQPVQYVLVLYHKTDSDAGIMPS